MGSLYGSHSVLLITKSSTLILSNTTQANFNTKCAFTYTGLFKMIVGVLTTRHTQYTWDRSICVFLFNRKTLKVFVTYLTGALYVHALWFYKHQHENRVRSKLSAACQHVACSLPFAAILVNCAPSGEMHNYCTPHVIKENYENLWIHRCKNILISQVYCVWQLLKPRQSFWITLYYTRKGTAEF